MPELAVFYEHPQWFEPLFRELDRRGVDWAPIRIQDHTFDPADPRPPAPVILSRLAMSSFLRQDEHALFYSVAAIGHWEDLGARVINGTRVLAYDLNKARQLSLFGQLGLAIPRTRVAHRREDVPRLAAELGYPVLVKANVGGSGAGIIRYDSP
ncbi:MAG TPA: alpha-L-glutamate ligase, partial [Caulobacteraceae bacterium]